MESKEKTAFILLLDKDDGIITIFAQNLWTASRVCLNPPTSLKGGYAKRQKVPRPVSRSPESNESFNLEFLNL